MTDRAGADLRKEVQARYAFAARANRSGSPRISASQGDTSHAGLRYRIGRLDTADAFAASSTAKARTDDRPEEAIPGQPRLRQSIGCR